MEKVVSVTVLIYIEASYLIYTICIAFYKNLIFIH